MSTVTPYWWPRRRADGFNPAAQDDQDAGFVPGTFECVETLGDTNPAPLDALTSDEHARIERRAVRRMYAVIVASLLLWYFGWLA